MNIALLEETPIAVPVGLGPYRRMHWDALPDEPRCELLFGRFFLSPSPSLRHQATLAALWSLLDRAASAVGASVWMAPLDVVLAEHSVVQPDLVYIRRERRSILGERIEGVPDLVVEIVSPATARRDRLEKLRLYAESGVREYWIVDHAAQQVEFLVNREGQFVVMLPLGAVYSSRELPELELDLARLWAEVDRRVSRG